MDLGLNGQPAVVLAASAGLGFATAHALAREGAHVALCSRDLNRAQDAARRIGEATGTPVRAYAADVADADSLTSFIDTAARDLGGLKILVCNAGGPPPGNFAALGEAQWAAAYQLTLMSVVRSVSAALPHLKAGGGGRILALLSSSVKRPLDNLTLSNALRPAVHGLCKSLSVELGPDNIQVNGLAPGRVLTERIQQLDEAAATRRGTTWQAVREASEREVPMGRLGTPDEFGQVAAFLCSPAAQYVNGSTLLVDGGAVTAL
ncbi:SDR family oxidoreductase [Deinococcus sp. KSM4-11]|uniref:SDR family oxidoreductase n=1 Tax=Deinococcus sp. KSM4-11 TaxID=2568654 RepID=UPI0010A3FC95|nr:SDR family oxidoreductase [Deinococcus sp. KSM4-11]THF86726.1 SDR family oxidoreductase [Deinococcus sp. KSM4-11]